MTLIERGLKKMQLSPEGRAGELLQRYLREIELWNPRYGLVNAQGDQLVIRHILDSLAAVPLLEQFHPACIADIGSGAGLPGIPLAIFLPDVQFDLIERSGRRAGFLRNALLALGLGNASVREIPLEEVRNRYDIVTFRGFSPFHSTLMGHLQRIVSPQGRIVAYKGKKRQIEEELGGLDRSAYKDVEIAAVSVPFLEEERHLVTMSL